MKAKATGALALVLLAVVTLSNPATAQSRPGGRNGLPPTTMDSFVANAAGNADQIYGDEGTYDIPPFFGYTYEHRINAGITGERDRCLTTNHGSMLPSAVGADEFITPGGEWSLSGTNNGNPQATGGAAGSDLSGLQNTALSAEQNLTATMDQLTQAQNNLQTAINAANQAGLTPAQLMAAKIAVDDARRQVSNLQNSVTSMQNNIGGLNNSLANAEDQAERY